MSELSPCPFCGHTMIDLHSSTCSGYGPLSYWIECCGCYTTTNAYDDEEQAIAAWNRRAGAAALEADQ